MYFSTGAALRRERRSPICPSHPRVERKLCLKWAGLASDSIELIV